MRRMENDMTDVECVIIWTKVVQQDRMIVMMSREIKESMRARDGNPGWLQKIEIWITRGSDAGWRAMVYR